MQGHLFVISAPSGAGKTTVSRALESAVKGLSYSVSHTTRRPRKGEKDGRDYLFVSHKTFDTLVKEDAFVEWARVYNEFYGTSVASIEVKLAKDNDVLLDLDVQGAGNIKKIFKDSTLIFLLPPSEKTLMDRLTGRGTDSDRVIKTRIQMAREEIRNCAWFDYIIINDDLETAIEEARAIIVAERCRPVRQMEKVKKLFAGLF
jgi:guanylate kinase